MKMKDVPSNINMQHKKQDKLPIIFIEEEKQNAELWFITFKLCKKDVYI
jgi:hypothetical protein